MGRCSIRAIALPVAAFRQSHAALLEALQALHHEVTADAELVALIRRKYRIKNTVGYSINALVDYHDPIDILVHLVIGSEGTLGFVSEVTYNTIPEHPHRVTGADPLPRSAQCRAGHHKARQWRRAVDDGRHRRRIRQRRALRTVEHLPVMQPYVRFFTENSPAVLIDVAAPTPEELATEIERAMAVLRERKAPLTSTFSPATKRAATTCGTCERAFSLRAARRANRAPP